MAVPALWPVAVGVMSLASWAAFYTLGTHNFAPGSCERMDTYLSEHIVGQDLALSQLVAAACVHMGMAEPQKPLIISVHGPPGVGKSYTHMLMAKVLYNRQPDHVIHCPGVGCSGYKVVFGLDFPRGDRLQQLELVEESILSHVKSARDPLLVFEEYDKLDCTARQWLRLLLTHGSDSGSMNRAIIILESNLGWTELEGLLTAAQGDTRKLTPEDAEKTLRDVLFSAWTNQHQPPPTSPTPADSTTSTTAAAGPGQPHQCVESYVDTLRFMKMVDFFLPYFPLQRHHIEALVRKSLERERVKLLDLKHVLLQWTEAQVTWLGSKVEFDGPYPLEGAKQVASVLTRYVATQIRKAPDSRKTHSKDKPLMLPLALPMDA